MRYRKLGKRTLFDFINERTRWRLLATIALGSNSSSHQAERLFENGQTVISSYWGRTRDMPAMIRCFDRWATAALGAIRKEPELRISGFC
ncbi:hypothetical protein TNCV_4129841 [Trichonephila clavipes]|nr:hypothetical protein TNCV_4129841 [Trichonephila clavipes]